MLVTQNIITSLYIPEDYQGYAYELTVSDGTCSGMPAIGTIIDIGFFNTSGDVNVTSVITYDDSNNCFIELIFTLYYNLEICNSSSYVISVSGIVIDPITHWECVGNNCVQTNGPATEPYHYNEPTCSGSCNIIAPIHFECVSGVCTEFSGSPMGPGQYTNMDCNNMCDNNPSGHFECIANWCTYIPDEPYDPFVLGHYNENTCGGNCNVIPPLNCKGMGIGNTSYDCNTGFINIQMGSNIANVYQVLIPQCGNVVQNFNTNSFSYDCTDMNYVNGTVLQIYVTGIYNTGMCNSFGLVGIDCFYNPCEGSQLDGSFVSDGGYSKNNCLISVPVITDNFDCQGSEDLISSNIYFTNICSKRGYFNNKYHKIIQGLSDCSNTIELTYTYVPSVAGNIYPTASYYSSFPTPTILAEYAINPSNVTQNLFSVINNNYVNGYVIDFPEIGTALSQNYLTTNEVTSDIGLAFLYWERLLSFVFGVSFHFTLVPYPFVPGILEGPDFYVAFLNESEFNNDSMFYNNGEILSSFGTPLNYKNTNIGKGGLIGLNINSPSTTFVKSLPSTNETCLIAEVFRAIGNALGLRNYYNDSNFNNVLECSEVNYNNSAFYQANTFMSHNIKGINVADYVETLPSVSISPGNAILDAFCIECIQKRYLL